LLQLLLKCYLRILQKESKMKKKLLFILMLIIGSFSFAENIVITSIQPLYSLTSYLTKGTDIKVYTPFGSDISMTMSKEAIREEGFNLAVAKKAQAVVDIARIWPEDVIYGKARMNKINIVEIDASHPYDEKMTTLFFSDYSNGKVNPYIWTGSKNLVRMVNIIARDLIKLYPQNKAKIEKNITKFTADLLKIENEANEKLLAVGEAEVISLSENLQYFLNDMNIYTEYVDYDSVNAQNIVKLIKDKGIKVIVSDRWLKKDAIKALKEAGGEFVIINTLDIPMDKDGKMDPEAILKAFKENTDNLIEALKK
jgi:iron/zinc/copper-binding protein